MTARTLFDKVWASHVVRRLPDGPELLYSDLHLVHEVTSPQAFEGLRLAGRRVRRPELTVATVDHNVPTDDRTRPIADALAARQVGALAANAREFGIELFDLASPRQGIVHVIGPELGLTQPGMVIVCGDSHTSTHGAFGALAFGIGTSEVEHVLATQCLVVMRPKTMEVRFEGAPAPGVTAKDLILALIGRIGTAGATGHVIEYTGAAIRGLSMEGRMTVCNMSIEAGARAGMIAPDDTTFGYLEGRARAPAGERFTRAVARWRRLASDEGAVYDTRVTLDAASLAPQVTWGTNPGMVADITARVPDPAGIASAAEREAVERALAYMDLRPGTPLEGLAIDRVFLGSCTNARIEDLRSAAGVVRGRRVAAGVRALVVPGSQQVKAQAEAEGLDRVFREAGFEWRNSGCSMCLGMNPDILASGERCAATSNRNFEGRQGRGGRTHLMSPAMAAAAGIAGHLVDIRRWARRCCSTIGATAPTALPTRRSSSISPPPRGPRFCSRARTSAAARRASTPCGHCGNTVSASSSRNRSPTSSTRTAARTACSRCAWCRERSATCSPGTPALVGGAPTMWSSISRRRPWWTTRASAPRSASRPITVRCCSPGSTRSDGPCSQKQRSRPSNAERGTWNVEQQSERRET